MADAALKLGNLISSKITGTLQDFGTGMKGAFISANPAAFGPMISTMGKMFASQSRSQKEAEQRRQGFEEERAAEQNKMFTDILSVMKGVASSLETIQKDVRAILEVLKEKGFFDKLGDFLKGLLAAIPAGIGKVLDEIIDFLKSIPGRIGSVIDNIIDFFKSIPGRLSSAFDNVIKFFSELPGRIMGALNAAIDFLKGIPGKISSLFGKILSLFDDFVNKYFPNTREALARFFGQLADILKLSKIKDFFDAVGNKFNEFIRMLGESDIGKAFRRIRNIFAISFAQYADELEDLFRNRIPQIFGSIKTSIGELGTKIMSSFDEAIDAFKNSKLMQLGDDIGSRITGAFGAVIDYIKTTKIGSIGEGFGGAITGLFEDVKGLFKLPAMEDLGTFFDLGKSAQTLEEFRYVLGEGGIIQQTVATVGKFVGDIGRFFSSTFTVVSEVGTKISDLLSGPLKFFGELTDLAPIFRALGSLAKILGPIGVIFSVIDGIVAAFDTEALAKTLGKATEDVTWKDRIAGFFGGVVGGVFGLFDLIIDLMGLEKGEESLQSRVTALMTKGIREVVATFGNIIDLIVGIITFNPEKISNASQSLLNVVQNSFKALANVFIDGLNWLIDKLPSWMQPSKLARVETLDTPVGQTTSSSANQTDATLSRLGIKPNESAGGGRGSSPGSTGYTAADLRAMGLNIKEGDVQLAGAYISPSTISGAKYAQSSVKGIRFTGFNDAYHDAHSPKSSHTKGLAFDFTIPPEAALDNNYRKQLAQAIASSTGSKVIDEYAYPSAKSTGGHFHVDFAGSKGVELGTGYYGGEKTDPVKPPTQPSSTVSTTPMTSTSQYDWGDMSSMDRRLGGGGYTGGITAPPEPKYQTIERPKPLTPEEAYAYAQAIAYYDAEKKRYDEEKKYRDERAQLENKFYGDLEGMVRPMVEALQGPAGSMDPSLARDAGRNIARGMQSDFTKLGTALFGKQYGAAMGNTFQELAGSYLDQFVNQALAPALGVSSEVMNRSINLYMKSRDFDKKVVRPAEEALKKAKDALEAKEKENPITTADIIRASGIGKNFSSQQLAKIKELDALREIVRQEEKKVADLNRQKREYRKVALEDLMYGMTGVPTGTRSLIEAYGGADALTRDLATLIGMPFSPAFKLGQSEPLQGPGADPRIALDQRLRQTETVLVQGGEIIAVKAAEGLVGGSAQGGEIIKNYIVSGAAEAGNIMRQSMSGGMSGGGGQSFLSQVTGQIVGEVTDKIVGGISDGFERIPLRGEDGSISKGAFVNPETGETYYLDDAVGGSGTAIPGVSKGWGKSGNADLDIGSIVRGGASRLPIDFDKMKAFGGNMLGNVMSNWIVSKLGPSGQIFAPMLSRTAMDFGRSMITGGKFDLMSSLGSSFGLTGSNIGFMDLVGGFNKMYGSPLAGIGKMGMNVLGSFMGPGGPTSALGEMGMNFFSGMQSSGNLFSNIGSMFSKGGSFGTSFGSGLGGVGNFAGQALGSIATGLQGYAISKMLSGGYSTGGKTVNTIAAIASMIPGIGPIAGVVGGIINRAFGRKPKQTTGTGLSGTLTTEGATNVQQYNEWFQKGGWFRSNRRGTDYKAADTETANALSAVAKETAQSVASLGQIIGLDPEKIKGFSKAFKIELKGLNETQQQEAFQKAFKSFGSDLAGYAYKSLGSFSRKDEDKFDTLSRLATSSQLFESVMTGPDVRKIMSYNMDALAKGVIDSFTGSLKDQTAALEEYLKLYVADFQSKLIDAYGGAEEFQKIESTLFDLLYTDDEKKQKMQEYTAKQMERAAKTLKDAGAAIDPEKLGATFEDNQKIAKDMLDAADKDLALGKITNEQYVSIRKAAADFLTAAKQNSQLTGDTGAQSTGPLTFDASKYMLGENTVATVKTTVAPAAVAPAVVAATSAAPSPVTTSYLAQEITSRSLANAPANVNNAVVDNSVTQVSNPRTTIINEGTGVRNYHPVSDFYKRNMIGSRVFMER